MSSPALSVILCTHNPRKEFLSATLNGLRAQSLPYENWEFLLVDNASERPLTDEWQLDWHPSARIIREDRVGLTQARLRGFRESRADVFVLVDDDNILSHDYLSHAVQISHEWPILGSWGGQTLPQFEQSPEDWTRAYWNWIGIRTLERDLWSNVPNDYTATPFGAGMCVRRQVAQAYAEAVESDPLRKSLDRTGTRLFAAGDTDLALFSCDLGLGNGLFQRLKLQHMMPSFRLEEDYLLRLVEAMTYSNVLLCYLRHLPLPTTPARAERLLRKYQSLFVPERERRFDQAKQRGRAAALALVHQLQNGCSVSELNLQPAGVSGAP